MMAAGARRWGIVAALLLAAGGALAQTPEVETSGGRDQSGQNYEWTLTNRTGKLIVAVEFPHYHADAFQPPRDWGQECTNLFKLNARDEPGVCKALAPPGGGIAPGGSAKFGMRISLQGTLRGKGVMIVRFADGSSTSIAGVDLPCAPTVINQYMYPVGIALILLLVVLTSRRRGKGKGGPPAGTEASGEASPDRADA